MVQNLKLLKTQCFMSSAVTFFQSLKNNNFSFAILVCCRWSLFSCGQCEYLLNLSKRPWRKSPSLAIPTAAWRRHVLSVPCSTVITFRDQLRNYEKIYGRQQCSREERTLELRHCLTLIFEQNLKEFKHGEKLHVAGGFTPILLRCFYVFIKIVICQVCGIKVLLTSSS